MKLAILVVILGVGVAHADDAKVVYGKITVKGALDAKAIEDTVQKSSIRLLICAVANGDVTVSFTVDANGKVTSAKAAGINAQAEKCVADGITKIAFDKPKDGKPVEVSLPITFVRFGITSVPAGGNADDKAEGGSTTGISTIGGGPGQVGRGGMQGRVGQVPALTLGQPTVIGSLDKAIVRRYIKRNIMKVQYCYEKQLLVKPKIEGTIKAEFTIDADGKVSAATATGFDETVSSCIANVMKQIEFAKPKAGTVTVKFPFTFKHNSAPAKAKK